VLPPDELLFEEPFPPELDAAPLLLPPLEVAAAWPPLVVGVPPPVVVVELLPVVWPVVIVEELPPLLLPLEETAEVVLAPNEEQAVEKSAPRSTAGIEIVRIWLSRGEHSIGSRGDLAFRRSSENGR
jgi:hypothetical protein